MPKQKLFSTPPKDVPATKWSVPKPEFVKLPQGLPKVSFNYAEDGWVDRARHVKIQLFEFDAGSRVIGYEYVVIGCNADCISGWVKKEFKGNWIMGEVVVHGSWKASDFMWE